MKELQVTAHLTSAERKMFEDYAREFLLDSAGLLALLFARQKRVGHFRELLDGDVPPAGCRKSKITFRLKTASEHLEFTKLAKDAGTSLSHAGAALVRREMKERWLETVVRDSIRVVN